MLTSGNHRLKNGSMEFSVEGVKAYRNRHGKWYYYHRKTGKRIKSRPGSPEFFAELAARNSTASAVPPRPLPGTLAALIADYRASAEFITLEPRTRADYQKVFDYLRPLETDLLVAVTPGYVAAVRDAAFKRKKRHFANYVKTVLSLLFAWAVSRGLMEFNPAARVKKIRRPKNAPEANRAWSREELQIVLAESPFEMRVAIALAVCTSLREGDVVIWPWSGYKDRLIQGRDAKTGSPVWMPAHPMLIALLEEHKERAAARAKKKGVNVVPLSLSPDMPIVTGQRGRPITEAGLRSNFFKVIRRLVREGKVASGVTFHGLRTTTATMLADADCDDATIQAVTGHKTVAMVAHYRRGADKKRRAAKGIAKLDFSLDADTA
jgi:integrase